MSEFTIPGMMPLAPVKAGAHINAQPDGSLGLPLVVLPADHIRPVFQFSILLPGNCLVWQDPTGSCVFATPAVNGKTVYSLVVPADTFPVGSSTLQVLRDNSDISSYTVRRPDHTFVIPTS